MKLHTSHRRFSFLHLLFRLSEKSHPFCLCCLLSIVFSVSLASKTPEMWSSYTLPFPVWENKYWIQMIHKKHHLLMILMQQCKPFLNLLMILLFLLAVHLSQH